MCLLQLLTCFVRGDDFLHDDFLYRHKVIFLGGTFLQLKL